MSNNDPSIHTGARVVAAKAALQAAIAASVAPTFSGVAGSVLGIVGEACIEHLNRNVTTRQVRRAGEAYRCTRERIEELAADGCLLRADLADGVDARSDLYFELAEGVFLLAMTSVEERKAQHVGWLAGSFSFDVTLTPSDGHAMLRLVEHLTFRQMCLLQAFIDCAELAWDDTTVASEAEAAPLVEAEIEGLRREGLLSRRGTWHEDVTVTPLGAKFSNLACLERLRDAPTYELAKSVVDRGKRMDPR